MKQFVKNVLGALAITFLTVSFAAAQAEDTPKQKLRSGVWIKGIVGGDGHQGYFIRVRKGQTITLQISRRVPKDGNFNLTVSRKANFFEAEGVKFGKQTSGQRFLRWTGKAPASGNYYFYLTGYNPNDPFTIDYKLMAAVK